jgi:hypothetical protein
MKTNPVEATAEQIWRAHRDVYRSLGQEEWANAIYKAYFENRGIPFE